MRQSTVVLLSTTASAKTVPNAASGPTKLARVPLLRWTFGLINRIVMASDVGVMLAASVVPLLRMMPHVDDIAWLQALLIAAIEASVFVRILRYGGAYRVENYEKFWSPLGALLPGLVCAWGVGAIYFLAFKPSDLSLTDAVWYWHVPQLAGLVLTRQIFRILARQVSARALTRRTVVLIGANPVGEAILRKILSPQERAQYDVVGVFADASDDRQTGDMLGVPISGDMNALGTYAMGHVIDLVIVALPLNRAIQTVTTIEHLRWMATNVVIPVEEIGLPPSFARLANIAGVSALQVLHRPLKGSQALVKIVEDYVIASILLIIISPLMLLIAIAIRLDSAGPAFFFQERTGFNNNSFWICKFRTMTVDPTDDGSVGTQTRDDPRITRVGRILRRCSLDEVPQLINVLRGEMSIVGPRPYVPNMLVGNEMFREAVRDYAYRYRLKPGITGLAQANGMRSAALRSMANAQKSVEMDLQYINNWSIWLDLRIMVHTVIVAMTGPEVF